MTLLAPFFQLHTDIYLSTLHSDHRPTMAPTSNQTSEMTSLDKHHPTVQLTPSVVRDFLEIRRTTRVQLVLRLPCSAWKLRPVPKKLTFDVPKCTMHLIPDLEELSYCIRS